ncbi:MAG: TetR/AcrR family transcriptional regulator [Promicromonosporaceae bacterium]|nr:TetR/AcrR family transcriptional regulator [Promicromonosporaceae bacterium]
MGRTSDARERLVAAALELFSRRPYAAVGVAEIARHAGVQKGSFYYFFESKEALAVAVIDEHWEWQRGQWQRLLAAGGPVLERLRGVFDLTAEMQTDSLSGTGSVVGCLFGNLALEVGSDGGEMAAHLQKIFDEQVDMIGAALREAVEAGELAPLDTAASARSVVAQLEGLVLFAKLFNDPAQLDALWANSLRLLGAPQPA